MKAELKKFLEHIANNVGEVITECHWREACELLKSLNEESEFKQGDKVLVRNIKHFDWIESVYVVEHRGRHYVETHDGKDLFSYKFIKPYEEEIKVGDWVKNREVITKFESFMSKDDLIKITNPELINLLEKNMLTRE